MEPGPDQTKKYGRMPMKKGGAFARLGGKMQERKYFDSGDHARGEETGKQHAHLSNQIPKGAGLRAGQMPAKSHMNPTTDGPAPADAGAE